MNITSKQQLVNALPYNHEARQPGLKALIAEATKRYGSLSDENFHEHRDFLRMNWSGAAGVVCDNKWEPVAGGLPRHFLHMSQDGERVCFAKSHEKAQADRFTTVTADRYKELFGMADEDIPHPDLVQTKIPENPKQDNPNHGTLEGLNSVLTNLVRDMRDDTAEENQTLLNMSIADSVNKALKILHILAKKGA